MTAPSRAAHLSTSVCNYARSSKECPAYNPPFDIARFYAEYAPYFSGLIRRLTDDPEIRKDLTGEAFLVLHRLVEVYDPSLGVPLRPYLLSQARAHLYSHCRSRRGIYRKESSLSDIDLVASIQADPTPSWQRSMEIRALCDSLPDMLARVSHRQRRVLTWRYFHDMTFEEIASRLNVCPATARSLLRHAVNRLRIIARTSAATPWPVD